ncbi:MAG: uracil-DNA glycosylase [Planctomycetaceae bacterium]|nr:uracil-DNA glycosylase [Planctomycetaceae bacterium]
MLSELLPAPWRPVLGDAASQENLQRLSQFLADEEQHKATVFPPRDRIFRALELTPPDKVRVVILGQDPYHDDGQAEGLSFSVPAGIAIPPSLRNIYRELNDDLGIPPANHGHLAAWCRQGVLLLNTVLTVRAHEANSHRKRGWEEITSAILNKINELPGVVFILWGAPAQQFARSIAERHLVLQSAHPSPLSAYRGFFGSRPFSKCNHWLRETHGTEIDWRLGEVSG